MSSFDPDFSLQISVPEVGEEGQRKLQEARVLVVGAGGTGSPAIMYLASCGLRRVDVCDPDTVEPSNLHRQILHQGVGMEKAVSASRWIRGRHNGTWCEWSTQKLEDVADFLPASEVANNRYDVILDCTDRWKSHRDVVMSALRGGKKVVHGSIAGLLGRVTTFSQETPCWLCLHPEKPEAVSKLPRGTVGPVCGVVGSLMALEAMKLILGMPAQSEGRMLTFDAASLQFLSLKMARRPGCPGCASLQQPSP